VALRDLVISQADLTEEQIEELIEPFARYDPAARQIVLLPPATELGNRQRVIAYLIALLGWPFVLPDDPPATGMTPAELEAALSISGGSLRPILKTLKDERLIQVADGRYSVHHVNFPFLREQLAAPTSERRPRSTNPKRAKKSEGGQSTASGSQESPSESTPSQPKSGRKKSPAKASNSKRGRRDATAAGAGPLERMRELISEGWFASPRTSRDIIEELGSRGATYRAQDLTRQLLILVRAKELSRTKAVQEATGRKAWHYQSSWVLHGA
jgi:hypothetical protein